MQLHTGAAIKRRLVSAFAAVSRFEVAVVLSRVGSGESELMRPPLSSTPFGENGFHDGFSCSIDVEVVGFAVASSAQFNLAVGNALGPNR